MPDTDQTRAWFDENAQHLDRASLIDKWGAIAPLFRGLGPETRVLEVGAGTGLYTVPMLSAGYDVVACDLSGASLRRAEGAALNSGVADGLETVVGDFAQMPGRAEFDAVTFIKVLHHYPDRASIASALTKAWELLRPGGRLIVFEPNGAHPLWPVLFRIRGSEYAEAERNTVLMRQGFFSGVVATLAGADSMHGWRFVLPGAVTRQSRILRALDRRLSDTPGIRAAGLNIWWRVDKVASPLDQSG